MGGSDRPDLVIISAIEEIDRVGRQSFAGLDVGAEPGKDCRPTAAVVGTMTKADRPM